MKASCQHHITVGKLGFVEITFDCDASINPGSNGSYWEPPEPAYIDELIITCQQWQDGENIIYRQQKLDWFLLMDDIIEQKLLQDCPQDLWEKLGEIDDYCD
jgi:hypothetical protein